MANTLDLFRNGAVGFIGWLDETGRTTDEARELDAGVDTGWGAVAAVASQMNLYRCDRWTRDQKDSPAGRWKAAD